MKKLIVITLLSFIFQLTHAQKVIEWPEFKGTTAPYLKILKIELHDTATFIDFRVRYIPGYWIQVSNDTWIQDSEGGEKLFVKNGKGIKINEQHITPENGLNEYTLIFPAVGKDVKSIDYMGSDWKIFGIEIAPNEIFSIFPEALLGNWLQTDGSNMWDVGFYENLAIYEGEIWKQVLVNSSDNVFHIMLQKENNKKKLIANLQGDNLLSVGIKRMKPLKEELKNEKIKFIYLTNPTSPKKIWETMIPDIPGEHYYLTEDEWNLLAARFKVSGIPHYVLVGKDGSVIKHGVYFASSNAELKKIFNEYLN